MLADSPGAVLSQERGARGLSLERVAAATRIRRRYLEALEEWRLDDLPGAVYARGYLRAYAEHLELDPRPLLAAVGGGPPQRRSSLSLGRLAPRLPAGLALTSPLLAGAGLLLLALAFGAYAWRQVDSIRVRPAPVATPVIAVPIADSVAVAASPLPAATTAPAAGRVIILALSVQEQSWIDVEVDGQPAFGPSGRFFDPGQVALFAGRRITVGSGKAATTMVTVDGRDLGTLGTAIREFKGDN